MHGDDGDRHGTVPRWLRAERGYEDAVVGSDTLAAMVAASVDRNADRVAQRYKGGVYDRSLVAADVVSPAPSGAYAALTYEAVGRIVRGLAGGFRELGVGAGDRVAIRSHTRMEWAHADLAVLRAGGVVTTIYPESSTERTRYLLEDADVTGVVVEGGEGLRTVAEVADGLDLAFVVTIDTDDSGDDGPADTGIAGAELLTLGDVYARGTADGDPPPPDRWLNVRDPGDLATLIYTSGTTGRPKGVRLTHRNVRANVNGLRKRLGPRPDKPPGMPVVDAEGVMLSVLPLAHVFERTVGQFTPLASGMTVAYAESPDSLAEDLRLVEPTAMTSVPRVYERIYGAVRAEADSPARERILDRAIDCARTWARTDDPGPALRLRHAVHDRLVYARIREQLGGNVEFLISGGGSLSKKLAELFLGIGLPVLEGYGLTETAPVVSTNPPEDVRPGTVGPPLVDVELRLDADRLPPEHRDRGVDEIGELLVAGPNVTEGYWRAPDATARAIDEDGYFRTGDIVSRGPDGYLAIEGRVASLLVLSTGKNVAPEPIEDALATVDLVDQVLVVGDDRRFVAALLVPDVEAVRAWGDRRGIGLPEDRAALCEDDRVRERFAAVVGAINESFERVERIKRFELVAEEWTEDADLLTPTLKKRRRAIVDRHWEAIERIYDGGGIAPTDQ